MPTYKEECLFVLTKDDIEFSINVRGDLIFIDQVDDIPRYLNLEISAKDWDVIKEYIDAKIKKSNEQG